MLTQEREPTVKAQQQPVVFESQAQRPRPKAGSHFRRRAWRVALLLPLVLGPLWILLLGGLPLGTVATGAGMLLVLAAGAAAYTDLRWRKIYNWTTYSTFLWAVGLNIAAALITLVDPTSRL